MGTNTISQRRRFQLTETEAKKVIKSLDDIARIIVTAKSRKESGDVDLTIGLSVLNSQINEILAIFDSLSPEDIVSVTKVVNYARGLLEGAGIPKDEFSLLEKLHKRL